MKQCLPIWWIWYGYIYLNTAWVRSSQTHVDYLHSCILAEVVSVWNQRRAHDLWVVFWCHWGSPAAATKGLLPFLLLPKRTVSGSPRWAQQGWPPHPLLPLPLSPPLFQASSGSDPCPPRLDPVSTTWDVQHPTSLAAYVLHSMCCSWVRQCSGAPFGYCVPRHVGLVLLQVSARMHALWWQGPQPPPGLIRPRFVCGLVQGVGGRAPFNRLWS